MHRIGLWLSTGLGVGYLPGAPGTFGTLWGLLLYYLARNLAWPFFGLATLGLLLAGVASAYSAEREFKSHDSPKIVIDEVVGYLVTVFLVPFTLWNALLGFVLFRIFDILKPYPIRWVDRHWRGPWGVMMDDVCAGVLANVSLQLIRYLWRF